MKQTQKKRNPYVKFSVDFLPLIGFLITYYTFGIMLGTIVLMILCVLAVVVSFTVEKKIPYMPILTAVIVVLFGGLTVYFNDERFIKIKPTIINLILAGVIGGAILFDKYPLRALLGTAIQMTEAGWRILSKRWALFFLGLAFMNEYVWRNFSTAIWVNFKVFGLLIITVIFAIFQSSVIEKYKLNPDQESEKI